MGKSKNRGEGPELEAAGPAQVLSRVYVRGEPGTGVSVGAGKAGGRIWATQGLSDRGERVKDDVWGGWDF